MNGNGISKYTRGQSDPRACLAFFETYLGAYEATDSCKNGKCECATQGRAQLDLSSKADGIQLPSLGADSQSFGVHAINCTYHPYGEYGLEDIENKMTKEVNDFKDGYNQHLDSHLGLYVSDLNYYIRLLDENSESYYLQKFTSGKYTYYSVMMQACGGFYIEMIAPEASGYDKTTFV
jgi:hypothetical protein